MEASCIIVIPVYRQPTEWEEKSFRQCLNVLCHHEIAIVTYEGLPVQRFNAIAKEYNYNIRYEYFDKNYFSSVKAYNHLMLSKEFYKRFLDYEYILIYQLDAWVFRDELDYWCSKGYDYIGAPFFKQEPEHSGNYANKICGVGNGGFSLRRTEYCLKVLNYPRFLPYIKIKDFNQHILTENIKIISKLYLLLRYDSVTGLEKYDVNEDYIFSNWHTYMKRNIAPTRDAISFSFEQFPSYTYKLNGNHLPFGCHAFHKYEYQDFWSKFIQ